MIHDFFRINLPYGFAKNAKGEWMAFNREYRPIGFNESSDKGQPGQSYLDLPVYTAYKRITEKFLLEIINSDANLIQRNNKKEIEKIFLYTDGTNPMNQSSDKPELWKSYFEKLKKLSKLKVDKD